MDRVVGQVVINAVGDSFVVDRPIGQPGVIKVKGKQFQIEGIGLFGDHECWTPGEDGGRPGWVKGYRVDVSESATFSVGDKVTVEEEDPLPVPSVKEILAAAVQAEAPKEKEPEDEPLPGELPPIPEEPETPAAIDDDDTEAPEVVVVEMPTLGSITSPLDNPPPVES